jgi:hemoglobin-like flavoprotein
LVYDTKPGKNVPKEHKMYQMMIKKIPNVHKIFLMAMKYTSNFQSKALQNLPKLGFLVSK